MYLASVSLLAQLAMQPVARLAERVHGLGGLSSQKLNHTWPNQDQTVVKQHFK